MDQFLDRHPDVAKSLEKKPDLLNDRNYLKRHKDLDEYLAEHPAVREELRENPSYFMRRENQLEARSAERGDLRASDRDRDRDRNTGDVDRDRNTVGVDRDRSAETDRDLDKKEVREMDHFLDKHRGIEKDLEKNPSLVNDLDYLKKHKSLDSFLRKNPRVEAEVKENPSAFMQKQQRLERRNHEMGREPAQKHKTKIEEKEQTHTPTPH
jgi:phage-related protein